MRRTALLFILVAIAIGIFPTPSTWAEETHRAKASATLHPTTTIPNETGYWINTKSKVRHNKSCRHYGKGKNGVPCKSNEGKPCKICGG